MVAGALAALTLGASAEVVIENARMCLTVGDDGGVRSLVVKKTGVECVPKGGRPIPLFSVTQDRPFNNEIKLIHPNKRTTYPANALRREGDRLTVGFATAPYEAVVDVKVTDSYVAFTLADFLVDEDDYGYLKMDVPPVASFRVLQLPVLDRANFGDWLNASWDERSAVGVVGTSPYADIDHEDRDGFRILTADLVRGRKLKGASAALVVADGREGFLDCMDRLERDFDLPLGVASRRSDAVNAFIYHVSGEASPRNIDRHIEWARRGGFTYMTFDTYNLCRDIGSWGVHGDYDWNENFPNGAADLKAMLAKVKAAGIRPGLHFLHTHIGLKSRYVTPVADPRLNKTRRFTLAQPLDDATNATEIAVFEPTEDAPLFGPCRVLQFGGELVSYESYTREPPYRFLGVKRGAWDTRVTAHPRGEVGGVLDVSEFGHPMSCYIDQDTDLQEEVSAKIAALYNCGFEYAYFDGSEGVNRPFNFHVSNAQYRQWKLFEPKPLFSEGAAKTHFGWHILSGANAFDVFLPETFKANLVKFPVAQAPLSWQDMTRVNFGWWYYYGPTRQPDGGGWRTRGTTPDQWHFACSQCLAWDCPATVFMNLDEIERDRANAEACFEVMRLWETARRRNLLTPEQKRMLRDTSREYRLSLVDGKAVLTESVAASWAESLDGAWRFRRAGGAWEDVTVPHDAAIAGPFNAAESGSTGKLPWVGKGEYARTLEIDLATANALASGGRAYLRFGGAMAKPRVFVNGTALGGWDYGYLSFDVDATDALRKGTNEVRVTVDTTEHKSRWYPGFGLYRSVELKVVPKGGVVPGSVRIVPTLVSKAEARVDVSYDVVGGGRRAFTRTVANPRLWDVDDPYLHEIEIGGERFAYGIRTAAFTADDGFHLNGRRVQLRGVNLHSDLGPLGMAFDADAAERQIRIMKEMGVNAIRMSHNPPATAFLDLCDRYGLLVWNECFDKWDGTSGRPAGVDLDDYVLTNLVALVRRDRNHPSVVCWSIGNEMRPQTETFADGVTKARVKLFADAVRAEDATRPVAAGCDLPKMAEAGLWDELDLTGWNYGRRYLPMKGKHPEKPLVYSESASAFSDIGFYSVPPAAYRDDYSTNSLATDSYDHTSATWSDIPDIEFLRMETDRYVAGEFVWTGFDYLGEPCPYVAEARSSYFGIVDLCGLPKDRYYLYRAYWRPEVTTCHILPHWNWARGTRLPVYVYTNGDEAELFLNGRSLGRRAKAEPPADYALDFEGMDVKRYPDYRANPYYRVCDKYRLRWHDVAFEPGELRAVCYRKGVKIGEAVVRTAGERAALRLTPDPMSVGRLAFVSCEIVDAQGVRLPRATDRVTFRVEGAGTLVATANGDPKDCDSFAAPSKRLYFGTAVAVVRRTGDGPVRLVATAPGLEPRTCALWADDRKD